MTKYLKFPDRETAIAALNDNGFIATDDNGKKFIVTDSHNHSLDIIGDIYCCAEYDCNGNLIEKYDEDGNLITESEKIDGWHMNFRGKLPEGWEQYIVNPKHPSRVFSNGNKSL